MLTKRRYRSSRRVTTNFCFPTPCIMRRTSFFFGIAAFLSCLVAVGCAPKPTGVQFSDEELASERPKASYNRITAPKSLRVSKPPSILPIRDTQTCSTYCAHVMRNCMAEFAMYASSEDCIATCRDSSWAAGNKGSVASDSLACRLTWAKAAAQDNRRCVDAGVTSPACLQVRSTATQTVPAINSAGLCVMGLYDSTDQPAWNAGAHCRDVILANRVAPVVADLGWVLRLHDVAHGLPSADIMKDCRAIISVFYDGRMNDASRYAAWLGSHAKRGRKIVILNNFGAYQDASDGRWLSHDTVNSALRIIGVRYDGQWTGDARKLAVGQKNTAIFVTVPNVKTASHYYRFTPTREDVVVHYEVLRSDLNEGSSAVVMTSPAGGMAMTRYYESAQGQELLNIGKFLRLSLLATP